MQTQTISTSPGSEGEHRAQQEFNSTLRAMAFYNKQILNYLSPLMLEFIARQEMLFIATADIKGECDCSFRAGLPGFVHVLSDKILAYPEYRGNGVYASLGNITENPHIGLLFIDFFQNKVGLHINGKARIVENDDLLERPDISPAMKAITKNPSKPSPERWLLIEVEEAYIHCSKHIPLLQKKLEQEIHWGSDDEQLKDGDAFKAKNCPRTWGNQEDSQLQLATCVK